MISFECLNAARKAEINRDNTTETTQIQTTQIQIIIQAMLKKSKVISFKLSSAELGQIKSMPGPAGKHLEATNESESAGSSLPGEPGGVLVQGRPGEGFRGLPGWPGARERTWA